MDPRAGAQTTNPKERKANNYETSDDRKASRYGKKGNGYG